MKKILLSSGFLIGAMAAQASTVSNPTMMISIETASGRHEAIVSTVTPSVTSIGHSITYARSCKPDAAGKPQIERATIFEGTTVTAQPKLLNDGQGVNVSLVAVTTRIKSMQRIEQGGCYIELPDVEGSSSNNNFDLGNERVEALSVKSSNGANFKVAVQLL